MNDWCDHIDMHIIMLIKSFSSMLALQKSKLFPKPRVKCPVEFAIAQYGTAWGMVPPRTKPPILGLESVFICGMTGLHVGLVALYEKAHIHELGPSY